jgi:hypothetical protein
MDFIFTALVLVSSFVLSAIIGGEIAKILVSRAIINSSDSRETTIRYYTREMVYSTKNWVAFSAAILGAVVYALTDKASLGFFATVVLTGLLWLLANKMVFPKKMGTNINHPSKEDPKKELVSSTNREDNKPVEQIPVI